jgi:hypothetical protein
VKDKLKEAIQGLTNKVNKVTAAHRHGGKPSVRALDELSNRQIDFENFIKDYKDTPQLHWRTPGELRALRGETFLIAFQYMSDKEATIYYETANWFNDDEIRTTSGTIFNINEILGFIKIPSTELLDTIKQ